MYVKNHVVTTGRHLSVSGRPWRDHNAKQLGAVVVFHDIGPRRANEEELRKHRWFLESIVEQVPLMIFVKEASELRFERFNRAGEALLGLMREEMIGKTSALFYDSDEDWQRVGNEAYPRIQAGATYQTEVRGRKRSGESFWMQFTGRLVDAADESKGTIWVIDDVDERHRAEDALKASRDVTPSPPCRAIASSNDSARPSCIRNIRPPWKLAWMPNPQSGGVRHSDESAFPSV